MKEILAQNIKGEQCAIDVYQKVLQLVKDKDPVTYNIVLTILEQEVEHEEDLQSLGEDLDSFDAAQRINIKSFGGRSAGGLPANRPPLSFEHTNCSAWAKDVAEPNCEAWQQLGSIGIPLVFSKNTNEVWLFNHKESGQSDPSSCLNES